MNYTVILQDDDRNTHSLHVEGADADDAAYNAKARTAWEMYGYEDLADALKQEPDFDHEAEMDTYATLYVFEGHLRSHR